MIYACRSMVPTCSKGRVGERRIGRATFSRGEVARERIAHANLVRIRDVVSDGGQLAIVMDLVAGGDLRHRLSEVGNLTPAEACDLLSQVFAGLTEVHKAGIAHRDLKPENVLLDSFADG